MKTSRSRTVLLVALACMALPLDAAQKKDFKYTAAAGTRIYITNDLGSVTLKPAAGRQVLISGAPSSDKITIDSRQNGNRIEARVSAAKDAGRNDTAALEVSVPADVTVVIHASQGPVTVEKVKGDLTIEAENAKVDVREASGSLDIRTMSGAVNLSNVASSTVEVRTVSGNVTLNAVAGPRVTVVSNKGAIKYDGDPGADGDYELNTHAGDIDVTLPAAAAVNLEGHSIKGSFTNDFQQAAAPASQANSFSGTNTTSGSNMELRSFSGKVRVKKR